MRDPVKARESKRRWEMRNPEKVREKRRRLSDWHREYHRKWRAENRDRVNAVHREWKARNPEKVRAQAAKYRERAKEVQKIWNGQNPDKVKAYKTRWRQANNGTEKYRSAQRAKNEKYWAANPAKVRLWAHKRRERLHKIKPVDGTGVNVLCQLISDSARLKCGICGKNMLKSDRSIDHIIPVSKGGSGEIWNLRIVHFRCNSKKYNKLPHEITNQHELIFD
jgi:5-methylcytosine-specific restriction endonuclease McrA